MPSTHYRYLPLMKTKAGEISALANLTPAARARILPVFHVCENVAPSFAPGLVATWAGQLCAIDGAFNANHQQNAAAFTTLLQAMRAGGVPTMPSVSIADPLFYQQAAIASVDGNGLIVKTTLPNIAATFSWVLSNGWPPNNIDLIVDLRHLGETDPATFAGYVAMMLNQNAGAIAPFRSVTLAAGAAPKDHGGLVRGVNTVPRRDWMLWSATAPAVGRRLDYGDYLTGHPDLTEPPGAAMGNATVSARYTLDQSWQIIKGVATGGAYGLPMRQQHQAHASTLVGTAGFGGLVGCWADAEFIAASASIVGRSGRQKWSEYAANRHISLVADRLP